jgi:hypothetical protein
MHTLHTRPDTGEISSCKKEEERDEELTLKFSLIKGQRKNNWKRKQNHKDISNDIGEIEQVKMCKKGTGLSLHVNGCA